MKVLHIIQRYPPALGGAEIWCRNICQFLAQKGIILKVATKNFMKFEETDSFATFEEKVIDLGRYDYDGNVFVERYKLSTAWSKGIKAKIISILLKVIKLEKTEIGSIFKISPHSFELYSSLYNEIKGVDLVHLHTLPYFHNIIGFIISY